MLEQTWHKADTLSLNENQNQSKSMLFLLKYYYCRKIPFLGITKISRTWLLTVKAKSEKKKKGQKYCKGSKESPKLITNLFYTSFWEFYLFAFKKYFILFSYYKIKKNLQKPHR